MYAIAFDLNENAKPVGNAHKFIADFLAKRGFSHRQGTLYYGDESVTIERVHAVIREMAKEFRWLKESVSDIRVLQRMDSDDLRPFVEQGDALGKKRGMIHSRK